MVQQLIRGLAWFPDKKPEEIKKAFSPKPKEFKNCRFGYFSELTRFGKTLKTPGVLITGSIDEKYSSKDASDLLQKYAGSKDVKVDITVETEHAFLKSITSGKLKGNYLDLRLIPPYDIEFVINTTKKLLKTMNASEIFLRTVESVNQKETFDPNPKNPLLCIEVITSSRVEDLKGFIEKKFGKLKLAKEKITKLKLN
ncbi:MAG: hypothetical protein JW727_03030 [Candidatus Aenigmarchaeota archaeon]|nr:hypothetical protein [Candidatus Aenigmarchaeota archaeon]